jgi:acetyltransferase-like isoleucine patch superfamily enzyme
MLGTALTRLRWLGWTAFYRLFGRFIFAEMGIGCTFEGWVEIPQFGGRIQLGRNVRICSNVSLTVVPGATLDLADDVFIGIGVVISSHSSVSIGRGTLVAEYVCLHDNDHAREPLGPLAERGFVTEDLQIGANSWIGAHAVLVRGAGMGDDCVLGAGAVLTKKLPNGTRAAGVPARPLAN